MLKYFKKNKGFTLIELLVVIAIIAVLASIVLVSLNTARIKGRDARRIADIKSLQVALELHYDGVGAGTYPTTLAALQTNGYIAAIPKDPKDGSTNYSYAYSGATHALGAQKTYHLGARLEGVTGSSGVLASDADFTSLGLTTFTGALFDGVGSGDLNGCEVTAVNSDSDECYDVIP